MRRALVIAAIVLAAFAALAIRVVTEGRSALATGDDWMTRGKPAEAIRAFEASARWYLPLAPHVDDAYGRLRALTKSEDPRLALAAWRSIRNAARATRTLWTPHTDDLAAADEAIAKLATADPEGAPIGDPAAGVDAAGRQAWHQARLSRDSRPSHGAAALAALGIVLWIGGALLLARRGVSDAGALVRRPALVAAAAIVVGLVCWAAGLYNA
ncbi:MAG TPA: hypothetical protein VIV11_13520 [Kofleriaceae bacterium]